MHTEKPLSGANSLPPNIIDKIYKLETRFEISVITGTDT